MKDRFDKYSILFYVVILLDIIVTNYDYDYASYFCRSVMILIIIRSFYQLFKKN